MHGTRYYPRISGVVLALGTLLVECLHIAVPVVLHNLFIC